MKNIKTAFQGFEAVEGIELWSIQEQIGRQGCWFFLKKNWFII